MDKYTFGKNLYELRNKKGLTQKELGKLLGVSDKAVSKWETGEAMPRTAKLVLITDLFGVTMEQLLENSAEIRAKAGDRAYLRAIHFVNENVRVQQEVAALRAEDFEGLFEKDQYIGPDTE